VRVGSAARGLQAAAFFGRKEGENLEKTRVVKTQHVLFFTGVLQHVWVVVSLTHEYDIYEGSSRTEE